MLLQIEIMQNRMEFNLYGLITFLRSELDVQGPSNVAVKSTSYETPLIETIVNFF